ncbi:MAG: hypothetical protein A4E49_03069 [Methanosaeta sp. PtaU1.Bin112]|nr:MAG: hypothetical protein A4E49_03069 [Methanosaeta sp. PtaU1.Bin112]
MISEELAISILDELKAMRERIDELERRLKDEMEVRVETAKKDEMAAEVETAAKDEIAAEECPKGLHLAGLLDMDPPLRSIVLDLTKKGSSRLSDLARRVDADEETLKARLKRLQDQGYVKETIREGESRYQAILAKRQPRKVALNIWNALEGRIKKGA